MNRIGRVNTKSNIIGFFLIFCSMMTFHTGVLLANAPAQALSSYDTSILSSINTLIKPHYPQITVKVANGIASLSGQLNSSSDYEQLIALVESTVGVVDVNVEKLTIPNYHLPLNDLLLTGKVKGALLQSGILGNNISTWPLKISSSEGELFVSGTVPSAEKKLAILNLIKALTGVKKTTENIGVSGAIN